MKPTKTDTTTDSLPREQYHNWGEYARSLTDLNWDGQAQTECDKLSQRFSTRSHRDNCYLDTTDI